MTRIEWTHRPGTKGETWNPVTGCTKLSAGCANCYAERHAERFWATQYRPVLRDDPARTIDCVSTSHHDRMIADGEARPRRFTDVQCHAEKLAAPLAWKAPRTVFVNSMSDLFHIDVPDAFIDQVFAVMALCQRHTFIVLTKRAARMRDYLRALSADDAGRPIIPARIVDAADRVMEKDDVRQMGWDFPVWPFPNVWLGVSVEDQATAKERIWPLLETPAALRFISAEPLLGPVDLVPLEAMCATWRRGLTIGTYLDWIIVGGESGPKARPCRVEWIRSIVQQCKDTSVPCFVKQVGAYPRVEPGRLRHWEWAGQIDQPDNERRFTQDDDYWRVHLEDRKGGDQTEWPADLRVREWPEVAR